MEIKASPSGQRSEKRGRKWIPALCNFLGTIILLAVIITFLPLTVPRALGYEIYNVVSGSMEPEIPIGSVIYVESVEPATIAEGEIIAFHSEDSIITHRVVQNRSLQGEFITKGDANPGEDMNPVAYSEVVGRVTRHFPVVGRLMAVYASRVGKIYILILTACGVMFNMLAKRLRDRRHEADLLQPEQEAPQKSQRIDKTSAAFIASSGNRKEHRKKASGTSAVMTKFGQSKWLRRGLMILLLGVFLFSAGGAWTILHQYHEGDALYESIAKEFTVAAEEETGSAEEADTPDETSSAQKSEGNTAKRKSSDETDAPLRINFDALLAANPDIVGWIYCKGTVINYPVVQAADDDYYLHRDFKRNYSIFGSIFQEAENRRGFQDANNILYGHHMRNGSMFASLENWMKQSYYEQHPYMWLMTPNGDYRVDLVAGYTTSATSDTYTVFQYNDVDFSAYLKEKVAQSNFRSRVTVDPEARFVVLSTCAYVFNNARYVLHGQLVPVASVGGVPTE